MIPKHLRDRLQEIFLVLRSVNSPKINPSKNWSRGGLVGGPVRDLFLGVPLREIDLILEGDATSLVTELVQQWDNLSTGLPRPEIRSKFESFGTVKLYFPVPLIENIHEVDIASARTESYPRPGRAPQVCYPVRIEEDLGRRDFSINALALLVSEDGGAELVDRFQSVEDLTLKQLRILHSKSFHEDPARILRAIRFLVRFGFSLETETKAYFEQAINAQFLSLLTPQRRFDEFRKSLNERNFVEVLQQLSKLGLFSEIHTEMQFEEDHLRTFEDLSPGFERQGRILGQLLQSVDDDVYERQLKEWGLSKIQAKEFVRLRSHVV